MKQIQELGNELNEWKQIGVRKPCALNGVYFDGVHSITYEQENQNEVYALTIFYHDDTELFRAWGVLTSPDCSYCRLSLNDGGVRIGEGCIDIVMINLEHNLVEVSFNLADGTGNKYVLKKVREAQIQTFGIRGATCSSCVKTIKRKLFSFQPQITNNFKTITVVSQNGVSVEALNELLSDTKYRIIAINLWEGLKSNLKLFFPLILIFSLVIIFTVLNSWYYSSDSHEVMRYFMAGYFFIFGGLKVINWKKFVSSYRAYDHLAKRSVIYASVYPAMEFVLGLLYYFSISLLYVNLFTFLLMSQKAYSVYKKILSGDMTQCACLGGFFNIPVTRVTLGEDLLMAIMALAMFLQVTI